MDGDDFFAMLLYATDTYNDAKYHNHIIFQFALTCATRKHDFTNTPTCEPVHIPLHEMRAVTLVVGCFNDRFMFIYSNL